MSNLLLHRLNVFRLFEKISLYIGLYFVKSRERMKCFEREKKLLQNVNDALTYKGKYETQEVSTRKFYVKYDVPDHELKVVADKEEDGFSNTITIILQKSFIQFFS